jgi:hypothetical protein
MEADKHRRHIFGHHNGEVPQVPSTEDRAAVPIFPETLKEGKQDKRKSDDELLAVIFSGKHTGNQQRQLRRDLAALNFSKEQIAAAEKRIEEAFQEVELTDEDKRALAIKDLEESVSPTREQLAEELRAIMLPEGGDANQEDETEIDVWSIELSPEIMRIWATNRLKNKILAKKEDTERTMAESVPIFTAEDVESIAIRRVAVELEGDGILGGIKGPPHSSYSD